jgi:hypothetical protein
MRIEGNITVTCDHPTEADGLQAMILASPSPEIESWSRDGLVFGVEICAVTPPPESPPDPPVEYAVVALTTAQTFCPTTADHDGTWGTDVRSANVAAGANNATSINDAGTTTTQTTMTYDPYTTRTTTGDQGTLFGWAINALAASTDGMGSASGARRRIPPGTWNVSGIISLPVAGTLTGTITAFFAFRFYRVSADGATRTFLFSVNTGTAQSTGLAAVNNTVITGTSASQPEYIFEPGETLHCSIQSVSTQVAGALGATVAAQITLTTGGSTFFTVPSPGIRTRYENTPGGTITPASARVQISVKRLFGSLGSLSGAVAMRTSRTITGTVTSSATMLKKLIRNTPYAGTITSSGAISKKVNRTFVSNITPGAGTVARLPIKRVAGTITPAAVATFRLFINRSGSITPHGALTKKVIRSFAGFFYGTGSTGGGTTIIKKVRTFIFDD